jgi:lipoprotein signal peptidase
MRIAAFLIGGGVFLVDVVTKWWVKTTPALHYYPVVDGLFTIRYVRNEGIAFGLFHDLDSSWKPFVLAAIAVAACGAVIYYLWTTPRHERLTFLGLGLLLGGILGNFTDRVMHHYVVDFLLLHWQDRFVWPTFNVADAAISCGVALILFRTVVLEARRGRQAAALLPFIWLSAAGRPVAWTAEEIVDRLQDRYGQLQTLRADFEQTLRSRGVSQTERGFVIMKRPGRMYWEYTDPAVKYFVADGNRSFFYVPAERQVIVSRLDLESGDSPLGFLLGKGDIRRDFTVELEPEAPSGAPVIRLTPRHPHPEFIYLEIEIDPETWLISRLTVAEPVGQEVEYRLTGLRQNVQVPERQFKLKWAPDVEVIEQ